MHVVERTCAALASACGESSRRFGPFSSSHRNRCAGLRREPFLEERNGRARSKRDAGGPFRLGPPTPPPERPDQGASGPPILDETPGVGRGLRGIRTGEDGRRKPEAVSLPTLPEIAEAGKQRGLDLRLIPLPLRCRCPGGRVTLAKRAGQVRPLRRGGGAPPYGVVSDGRPVGATCGRPPSIPRHCEPVRRLAWQSVLPSLAVTVGRIISAPTNAPGKRPVPPTGPSGGTLPGNIP